MKRNLDVVVIGAGIVGLCIARTASKLGLTVAVIDAGISSASWAAAGMLAPVTEAHYGEEALLSLNLAAAERYPGFIDDLSEESGHKISLLARGTFTVALDRDQAESLERLFDYQTKSGLKVEKMPGSKARSLIPWLSPRVRLAVHAPDDSAVDPREVLGALNVVCAGAERIDGRAGRVGTTNGAVDVLLESGVRVSAPRVVIACGAHTGSIEGLPAFVRDSLRPVKGLALRLARPPGVPPSLQHVVRTEDMYLVPRAINEMVLGASMEEKAFDQSANVGPAYELMRAAIEAVPIIRELSISELSVGHRPTTPDNAAMVGEVDDGVIVATGHGRNGVLQAPVTADAVGRLLTGQEVPRELAAFSPHRFEATS